MASNKIERALNKSSWKLDFKRPTVVKEKHKYESSFLESVFCFALLFTQVFPPPFHEMTSHPDVGYQSPLNEITLSRTTLLKLKCFSFFLVNTYCCDRMDLWTNNVRVKKGDEKFPVRNEKIPWHSCRIYVRAWFASVSRSFRELLLAFRNSPKVKMISVHSVWSSQIYHRSSYRGFKISSLF